MKKLCFVITALWVSTALLAQEQPKFGIKGGLNIATLHLEDNESNDARLNFHLGALAHIHLSPQWALQPEIVYSGQGMEEKVTGDKNTWKLNYLNIPIMVQYMFNNGFRIETGPQLGFLTNAEIEDENGNDLDIKDDLKKTDVSWGLGLSYLSDVGVGFGARYNLGLTNVNEYDETNKVTNRVFQLGIFYLFDHSHKRKSR